jgi:hypothetical protein
MNVAMGVRTPAAVLVRLGRETQQTAFSHFMDALKRSRRREARRVIARYAYLLPPGHPWRTGRHRWKS